MILSEWQFVWINHGAGSVSVHLNSLLIACYSYGERCQTWVAVHILYVLGIDGRGRALNRPSSVLLDKNLTMSNTSGQENGQEQGWNLTEHPKSIHPIMTKWINSAWNSCKFIKNEKQHGKNNSTCIHSLFRDTYKSSSATSCFQWPSVRCFCTWLGPTCGKFSRLAMIWKDTHLSYHRG